jgi:hypothetical protein
VVVVSPRVANAAQTAGQEFRSHDASRAGAAAAARVGPGNS